MTTGQVMTRHGIPVTNRIHIHIGHYPSQPAVLCGRLVTDVAEVEYGTADDREPLNFPDVYCRLCLRRLNRLALEAAEPAPLTETQYCVVCKVGKTIAVQNDQGQDVCPACFNPLQAAAPRMCEDIIPGGRLDAPLAGYRCSYKATQVTRRRMGYDNEPDFLCRRHAKARFPESEYREMSAQEKAGGEWEGCAGDHHWAYSSQAEDGWGFDGARWFRLCIDCGEMETRAAV